MNRLLTSEEYRLVHWMLERSVVPQARDFLGQLDDAEVTPERCPCGCASLFFQVRGRAIPKPGVRDLGTFVFGRGDMLSGIFVYENENILRGLEVYGLAGDAPRELPTPEDLREMVD
jgi:hypothetical protein